MVIRGYLTLLLWIRILSHKTSITGLLELYLCQFTPIEATYLNPHLLPSKNEP